MTKKKNLFQSSLTARFKAQGRIGKVSSRAASASTSTHPASLHDSSNSTPSQTNDEEPDLTINNIKLKKDAVEAIKGAFLLTVDFDKVDKPCIKNATSKQWISDVLPSGYSLVPFKLFCYTWRRRSDVYQHYHFLCLNNTLQCVGWAVCNHCFTHECSIDSGTKRYQPNVSSSSFHRHLETHTSVLNEQVNVINVPRHVKEQVIIAASKACALDNLPLSFAYQRKGMETFASTLIEIGQRYSTSSEINIKSLLPSHHAVHDGVLKLAEQYRNDFKSDLKQIVEFGGGVSCDGVKIEQTSKKYYDFVLNYVQVQKRSLTEGGGKRAVLKSRLLFIVNHTGPETAVEIRNTIDRNLIQTTGMPLSQFEKQFTFVTDCAATMPCVFGASVSEAKVRYCERWIGCICHQLNTAMKKAMCDKHISDGEIGKDYERVRKIVKLFKKASLNVEMPDGSALIQQVETRFGTVHDVAARFIKAAPHVQPVIDQHDAGSSEKLSALYDEICKFGGKFPTLDAIVECFKGIRHAQTVLEANRRVTITDVIPMLQKIKSNLRIFSFNRSANAEIDAQQDHIRTLAHITLSKIEEIPYQDYWIAACVLHPGLSSMPFLPISVREDMRAKGELLVRKMLQAQQSTASSTTNQCQLDATITPVGNNLGDSHWSLANMMTFSKAAVTIDELTMFQSEVLSEEEKAHIVKNENDGILQFWASKLDKYPNLARVALRIYSTPASSSASERDFSLFKLILSPTRSRLSDDVLEGLAYLRSALNEEHN